MLLQINISEKNSKDNSTKVTNTCDFCKNTNNDSSIAETYNNLSIAKTNDDLSITEYNKIAEYYENNSEKYKIFDMPV